MKKIIYIAAVAAAAFCFSCTKQEVSDASQSDKEIGFSTYTGRSITKASSNDDPFLVSAYYNGNSYFDAQSVTLSGSTWSLSTPYFWPTTVDASNKMEFYAVRKMSSGDNHTFSGKVVTVGTALTADSDIRTAYAQVTSVPDGAQNLTFTHDLAKVKFTLKAADQDLVYTVTDMKVTAKKTGTLTLAAAGEGTATRTWATSGSAADYSISGYPSSPTTTASSAFGETNVIPQSGVTVSVTYSVATSGSVEVMASTTKTTTIDLSSNRGKTTQYNISLPSGSSEISVTCSVTDWNTQTDVEQGWDPEFVGVKQTIPVLTTTKYYNLSGVLLRPNSSVIVDYGDDSSEETLTNNSSTDSLFIPNHTYSSTGTYDVTYTTGTGSADILPVFGTTVNTSDKFTVLSSADHMIYTVSDTHHNNVLQKLSSEEATIHSNEFTCSETYDTHCGIVTFICDQTQIDSLFNELTAITVSWCSFPTTVTSKTTNFEGIASYQNVYTAGVFIFPDALTSLYSYFAPTSLNSIQIQTSKGIFFSEEESSLDVTLGNGDIVTLQKWTCVPAGTKILVSLDGKTKLVEDLKPGDDIVAWSEKDSKNVLTDVKSLVSGFVSSKVELTFTNGDKFTMSESHPLLTEEGWKAYAPTGNVTHQKLMPGDKIFTYDGTLAEIASVELITEELRVYAPDVNDNYNTYYAGSMNGTMLLSHNPPK